MDQSCYQDDYTGMITDLGTALSRSSPTWKHARFFASVRFFLICIN